MKGFAGLLLVLLLAGPLGAWGGYEDFTRTSLWTETDSGNMLSIGTGGTAVSTTVKEDPGARLVGDFGATYFADFEFRFTGDHESSFSTYGEWRMGVSDADGFWPDADDGDSVWLKIATNAPAVNTVTLLSVTGGSASESGDSFTVSTGTDYYATFSRSGTTLTAAFYSDAGRTQHINGSPIAMTCISTTLRYLHVWNAKSDTARNITWDVVAFDMNRAPAQTTSFYVDGTNGDNSYDGLTLDHSGGLDHGPFKTINYSVNFWRVGAGSTVYVRGGTYFESATFGKGGSAGSPLTLTRYEAETPIIDGSYPVPASAWTACANAGDALGNENWANMYYCTLPAGPEMNSNLYQGDAYLNLAQDCEPADRWYYYNEENWHHRRVDVTSTTLTDANLPAYGGAALVGGYVATRTTSNTVGQGLITAFNSETDTITFEDLGNPEKTTGGYYIYVLFNSPSDYIFDDEGEYVIGADRTCVVWPWDETDLTAAADGTVTASVRTYQVYPYSYSYIVLDGLTIRRGYGNAIVATGSFITMQNCTVTQCAGVNGVACNHCYLTGSNATFHNNTLTWGRGQTRGLVGTASDSVWTNNTIGHYSGSCICALGGDRSRIVDNTIYSSTGPHSNAIAVQYCADKCLIARNKVVDVPRLTLSYSENVTICHNVLDYATWGSYYVMDNGGCTGYIRVFNNTMLGPGTYYFLKSWASSWDTTVFKNNVIDSSNCTSTDHTYNVFTSDNHWTLDGTESVNYSEPSLIVDWGNEDYTPVEDGDLHDAGTDVSGLFDTTAWPSFNFNLDLDGNARTGTWDIGAVERGAGAAPSYHLVIRSGS
ncbi:MAG TPA: right-handed parallel beta-helix repeat-containing protein [Phycisphaerae bacterium]|nr:right-handed parallel beta-helix repeat-containing protein [Phycisphaerae bacterium]